jgi:hypothetical protein
MNSKGKEVKEISKKQQYDFLHYDINLNSRKKYRTLLYLMIWVPLFVILLLVIVEIYIQNIL